jgi:hypothetical protein
VIPRYASYGQQDILSFVHPLQALVLPSDGDVTTPGILFMIPLQRACHYLLSVRDDSYLTVLHSSLPIVSSILPSLYLSISLRHTRHSFNLLESIQSPLHSSLQGFSETLLLHDWCRLTLLALTLDFEITLFVHGTAWTIVGGWHLMLR